MTEEQKELFGIDKLNVPRSSIPAITHVDGTARVQMVHREVLPLYHRLISAFERRTGVAALLNTSFNVKGQPIVNTPRCRPTTLVRSSNSGGHARSQSAARGTTAKGSTGTRWRGPRAQPPNQSLRQAMRIMAHQYVRYFAVLEQGIINM